MHLRIACILAVLGVTNIASAEEVSHPVFDGTLYLSVGTGGIDDANFDVDEKNFKFSLEGNVWLSSNLTIDLDFAHTKTELTSGNDSLKTNTSRFNLTPTYAFDGGLYAGLYLQDFKFDVLGIVPVDLESYGAILGFENERFKVEGYAGRTTLHVAELQGASIDANNMGLIGRIKASENLEIFAHHSLARLGDDQLSGDAHITALGAAYSMKGGISLFGAFSVAEMETGMDPIRQASLGLSYDLEERGLPGAISFDWSRTDYGSNLSQHDTFSIGWTIPLGSAKAKPQTCTMNNARGKNRAAIAAMFECSLGFVGVM